VKKGAYSAIAAFSLWPTSAIEARNALDASRRADRLIARELFADGDQRLELKTNLKTRTQGILLPSFYAGKALVWTDYSGTIARPA
jgi:hypothetical protein